ncbi:prenyltransferase, UbiA family [Segatella oris F0302]|uniref:Prenyltransferase, UbiA family n=1 Tax=Segatella oris F0302 TaxID=649760 RepID=D1QV68_9BACT|nr:decaprenyl-phosphate phosphoribosyltransferase [Segatella oris]EFB30734.1 prenyltransferase, UbiA family [Segatella oris F0302]MBF1449179.1 decaprenyl-phosphate phosphoribosyltransferase [Segatella oris]
MNIKNYMKILRPKQWMKNFFVMLPLFFGGELFNGKALLAGAITFLAYSFAASSIYCFNDIHDVDDDRRHPVKRLRPIASGAVSASVAYALMFICFALSMLSMFFLPDYALQTGGILLLYWLLNLAYCARLKQYAIIDVCIVAFGFVLRLLAGGFATHIPLSKWIVLMTFLITLFMSFAKRRDDVIRMERTGEAPRKNTIRYNLTFINQAITITASVTLVCYIMYTVSPEVIQNFQTDYLYLTTIFVLVGLLRYIQLTVVDQKSGDPTKVLLKDRFTQLVVVAWLLTFLLIIYVLKG